jgi:Type IV secretory system Conjugative DNA transfer
MTTPHLGDRPHPVVASAARELLNKSENERSGVLSTAMSFLGLYRDPVVAKVTSRCDWRITDLIEWDGPATLYLVVPPSDISRTKPLVRPRRQSRSQQRRSEPRVFPWPLQAPLHRERLGCGSPHARHQRSPESRASLPRSRHGSRGGHQIIPNHRAHWAGRTRQATPDQHDRATSASADAGESGRSSDDRCDQGLPTEDSPSIHRQRRAVSRARDIRKLRQTDRRVPRRIARIISKKREVRIIPDSDAGHLGRGSRLALRCAALAG